MNWEDLQMGDVVVTRSSTYLILNNDRSNDLIQMVYLEDGKVIKVYPSRLFDLDHAKETVYRNGEEI